MIAVPAWLRALSAALCLLPATAWSQRAAAPSAGATEPEIPAEVRAYLSVALDSLERVAMRRDVTDWRTVRDSTFLLAAGAQRINQAYGALNWALQRVDRHSFLQVPWPWVSPELVGGRYGYLRVPFHPASAKAELADTLQTAIRTLETAGACGWVIDLRDNGGGNVWPMIAGIGPFLEDSVVTIHRRTDGRIDRALYINGAAINAPADEERNVIARASAPYTLLRPGAPVAVLMNGATASSAEAVAIALRTRPNTRFFGEPSGGYTTANRGVALADGANMVVTIEAMSDRTGRQYLEPLTPDVAVPLPKEFAPKSAVDAVARAATAWLAQHPGCAAGR